MAAGTPVRLTVSAFDAMMKEIYPDLRIKSLAIRNRPLLEWMPKADEFYGDTYVIPVLWEDPQGRSADLAKAITNAETSKQSKFVLTARRKDYQVIKIEAEAIMAASKDVGSFLRAKDTQMQGSIRNMGKSLHMALYRSVSGSLGQISAVTDTVITLTNKSDVYNFGVGQTLVASTADGGGAVKANASKVAKVDHANGKLTMEDDVDSFGAAWAANDFLFNEGDYDVRLAGLASWLPLTAPGATAFFTVDRTQNIAALSGHRVDNTGHSIIENAEELAMLIGEFGGEPDTLFMNPRQGRVLAESVGAKVSRSEGGRVKVGFSGFTLEHFITGPIDIRFDIGCPVGRAYMLQRDTWKFLHMGEVPHLVRDDGKDGQRGATTDDVEYRLRYFGELGCFAPGFNGVMSVATTGL